MKRRLTAITGLCCLLALLGTPAATADSTADSGGSDTSTESAPDEVSDLERVGGYVEPSVVYIQTNWTGYIYDTFNKAYLKNAKPFTISTQCTGYVINPEGYIATAGHCVDPRGDIIAMMVQAGAEWALTTGYYAATDLSIDDVIGFGDYRVEGLGDGTRVPDREVLAAWPVSAGGVDTSETSTARVLSFAGFEREDVGLLKIEASTDLQALPLADADELGVGTEIVAVGYPGSVDAVTDVSFSPSFKDGTISSTKTINDGSLTVYEISAAMSGGMSGGPAVNLDGEVVGFNSFTISGETQQFNFLRPTSIVREFLADKGIVNELGETGEQYRAGLDAYFSGDKEAAIENLQAVVDAQSTNQFAADYLDRAEELPDPAPVAVAPVSVTDEFPLVPVAIGAGVVLVLLTVGGLVLARRGRRGPSPGAQPAFPGPLPGAAGAPAPPWAPPPVHPVAPAAQEWPPQPVGFTSSAFDPVGGPEPTSAGGPMVVPQVPLVPQAPGPTIPEQAAAAFCTSCGARVSTQGRFCATCGAQL